jgi:hypothetical protein
MKKLFTIFSIAFALSSSAQISIVRSDYGAVGDKVRLAIDTPVATSFGTTVLTTGANKTWDFTGMIANKYDSILYTAPGTGAPVTSNLLATSNTSSQYEYVDTSFVKYILDKPANNITGLTIKIFNFPMNYGGTFSDTMIYYRAGTPSDFNAPILSTIGFDSVKADIKAYNTTTCVGWGQIILPDTTCSALQIKVSTVSNLYLYGHTSASGWSLINSLAGIAPHQKTIEYQWLGKNSKSYLARASMDTLNLTVQSFTYRVKKVVLPIIKSVSPATAHRGQTINIIINASNTHFTQYSTSMHVYINQSTNLLNTNSVVVLNDSTLSANISISQSNPLGLYDVIVGDPVNADITLTGAFTVTASISTPILVKSTPVRIIGSQTLNVTITGSNTHFTQGSTTVTFFIQGSQSTSVHTNNSNVVNDSTLVSNVTFFATASNGNYDIHTNNTVDGALVLTNAFAIATGIDQVQKNNASVSMYPNPANEVINISFATQPAEVTIAVYEMTGRLLKSVTTNKNSTSLDVSDLKNGIYFVTLSGKELNTSRKIIINK